MPLSCGQVEPRGLRCGYHGLLFDGDGTCVEIPGQARIPAARVPAYPLVERDQILWIWISNTPDSRPADPPPAYPVHGDPAYKSTPVRIGHDG